MPEDDASHIIRLSVVWQVYRVPIIFGLLSLFFVALSITIFIKSYQPETPIMFSSDRSEATVAGARIESTIMVDVEGAVKYPGVYELPKESRVKDAIEKAGGFAVDADMDAVSRGTNQAAVILDGAKIFVPKIGDSSASKTIGSVSVGVNINTASQSELEALSGIGPVTAGKIMSGRPYMRLEELVEKKAMSQSLYEKLKDQLTL